MWGSLATICEGEPGTKASLTVHAHLFLHLDIYMYLHVLYRFVLHLLFTVGGGRSKLYQTSPGGEGKGRHSTYIQLLHPVIATILGKGTGENEEEEVRKKERMEDGEWNKK